jgi:Kef-type K+ transport system membrane component KefB
MALMAGVGTLAPEVGLFAPARISVGYGFLLLVSFILGELAARLRLPRLSGYILTGMVCGPHLLGLIDRELVGQMGLIDDLALTFIALTAGAELHLAVLRRQARTIGWVILAGTAITALGTVAVVWWSRDAFPITRGLGSAEVLVVGTLMGVIAVARSPTSAIAIIRECRARGAFTDTVFGVTVAVDSLVILLFAVALAIGQAAMPGGQGLDAGFVGRVFAEMLVSVAAGAGIGVVLTSYICRIEKELIVLLVVLSFLITYASHGIARLSGVWLGVSFHLEPLLIATVAGFVVQNFSRCGEQLVESLHAVSLPIFVVFFSMAGVGLDLSALAQTWTLALGLVLLRMVLLGGSSFLGCTLAGESPRFSRLCGLTFFTQAGVSIGLAQIIESRFPTWGGALETFLVACIALNQILGPLPFKFALDRIGDSGREP